jgi:peptidoglycan/LPS O-acetylase OafA/YrhL
VTPTIESAPQRKPLAHPEENSAPQHLPELDGLRGLAILLILIFHFDADLPRQLFPIGPFYFAWSGVDLFFVLSGFLITRILLRTRGEPGYFRTFYIRRALRIFPLYYGVLAICALLSLAVPASRVFFPSAHDQVFYWIYLSNWTPLLATSDQRSIAHFWSLAIEEQFYWIWPFLVWKVRPARLPLVAGGCILAASCLRTMLYSAASEPFIYRGAFCRMDGLMAGALCALLVCRPEFQARLRRYIGYLPFVGVVLWEAAVAGGILLKNRFLYSIGFTMIDVAYALLLLSIVHHAGWLRGVFRWRAARALGKYSYGIYVLHQPIYYAFRQYQVVPRGLPMAAATLSVSLILAVASYELFEKRFLRLKDRWSQPPSAGSACADHPPSSSPQLHRC